MAALKKDRAISKLTEAIHALKQDDIVDVYNELFPEHPSDAVTVNRNLREFQKQILDHIDKGLDVEEVLDLWRVVFPKDRRVQFNEETNEFTYDDSGLLYAER